MLEQRQPPSFRAAGLNPPARPVSRCSVTVLTPPPSVVLKMALKCADICNPCRPWELSKQWSEKVTEEFFQQGFVCALISSIPLILLLLLLLVCVES